MELLWTRSERLGSRIIRAVTGEDVSHVALRIGNFVLHSRMSRGGVEILPYRIFQRDNKIVYRRGVVIEQKLATLYEKYYSKFYDFGALAYLGLRYLLPWLPKVNLWQSTGMYLCTELVTDIIDNKEQSMLTPGQLYHRLIGEN